jgi:hypothetical protein
MMHASSGNLDGAFYLQREQRQQREQRDAKRLATARCARAVFGRVAWLKAHADSPRLASFDICNATRAHVVGEPNILFGSPEGLDILSQVSASDMRVWCEGRQHAGGAVVLIVWTVDATEVLGESEAWFADRKDGGPRPAVQEPLHRVVHLDSRTFYNSILGTAQLEVWCVLPDDGPVSRVFARALARASWDQLRERQGLTYGVHNSIVRQGPCAALGWAATGLSTFNRPSGCSRTSLAISVTCVRSTSESATSRCKLARSGSTSVGQLPAFGAVSSIF